jgi:hypothetical protein
MLDSDIIRTVKYFPLLNRLPLSPSHRKRHRPNFSTPRISYSNMLTHLLFQGIMTTFRNNQERYLPVANTSQGADREQPFTSKYLFLVYRTETLLLLKEYL